MREVCEAKSGMPANRNVACVMCGVSGGVHVRGMRGNGAVCV